MEYTVREENPERFPADFTNALAFRIAAYIAPRITKGDRNAIRLGNRALQLYAAEIARAQATAANEVQLDEAPQSEFIVEREGDTAQFNRGENFVDFDFPSWP